MLDYYVYRHIRPDTNDVFYIGIGNNRDKRFVPYARAKNKGNRRSDFWKRVVSKNEGKFECEIIYECDTFKECNDKEMEFIKLYGRANLGYGTLVNLTDGGSGAKNTVMSKEVRLKHSEPMKGAKNKFAKKVINVVTGEIFDTLSFAEENCGYGTMLGKFLRGDNINSSPFLYLNKFKEIGADKAMECILQQKSTSMSNRKHSSISKYKMSINSINKGGIRVLDTETNEMYPTISEVCRVFKIKHSTLSHKLSGSRNNNTQFIYL